VVEVLVALDAADVRRVIRLAGLKVIARFEP
jgi:HlyD family secretion protein